MRIDFDRPFQLLKRLRRRFYLADYRDAELHHRWSQPRAEGPYAEQVFEVIPSAEAVTSLLIFKPDEIGDAVYALPAVAELRRAFPKARVYLLCQRLTRPLYERTQLFDEIVDIAPGTRLTRPVFSVQEALGRFSVEAFDMSVFLRTYPAYFRQFRSIPAKLQVHPVDPHMRSDSVHRAHVGLWEDERVHQSLQLLQIVARVTGKAYSWDHVRFPEFEWSREDRLAEERTFGGNGPDRFVVVHPFVKHETRQYPLAYWVVLIERLRRAVDAQWVIVGGPDDPRIEGLPDVIQTQGELSLSQTGYLLSRAAGFIGVLSGPAHWAAALGTPTVTIMSGHSLPIEWAPLGQSLVIRAEVPCAPCHQKTCPVYGLACLTELTPERIAPSIEDFLANATRQSVRLGSA
jgi:ADP-heptose:LPS heptosyltransferase